MSDDFKFLSLLWKNNHPKIDINLNSQQQKFVSMMSELFLLNVVNVPTHKDNNILDLVLTNDIDMISSLRVDENEKFSDHKLIICDLYM